MDISELTDHTINDPKARRREDFAEYRSLLDKSRTQTGKLTNPADRQRFGELIAALKLQPDDIERHRAALDRLERRARDTATLAKAEATAKELRPQVTKWAEKRAAIVAKIDAEGAPILNALAAAEKEIEHVGIRIAASGGIESENRVAVHAPAGSSDGAGVLLKRATMD